MRANVCMSKNVKMDMSLILSLSDSLVINIV